MFLVAPTTARPHEEWRKHEFWELNGGWVATVRGHSLICRVPKDATEERRDEMLAAAELAFHDGYHAAEQDIRRKVKSFLEIW